MILQTELQLRAFHSIPAEHRMLQVDATGRLVKVLKSERKFNTILNYFMLARNINDLDQIGGHVTEMCTSRHDTLQIGEMFNLFIYNFKTLYQVLYKLN